MKIESDLNLSREMATKDKDFWLCIHPPNPTIGINVKSISFFFDSFSSFCSNYSIAFRVNPVDLINFQSEEHFKMPAARKSVGGGARKSTGTKGRKSVGNSTGA